MYIEVTYYFPYLPDKDETMEIEVSDRMYERLETAVNEGATLDHAYIYENYPKFHRRIVNSYPSHKNLQDIEEDELEYELQLPIYTS